MAATASYNLSQSNDIFGFMKRYYVPELKAVMNKGSILHAGSYQMNWDMFTTTRTAHGTDIPPAFQVGPHTTFANIVRPFMFLVTMEPLPRERTVDSEGNWVRGVECDLVEQSQTYREKFTE